MCMMIEASYEPSDRGELGRFIKLNLASKSSTTIESRKFRIPSDLRRQPGYRPVSSKVGDHLRILLGVVVHSFLLSADTEVMAENKCSKAGRAVIVVCMRCVCMIISFS
jgi:hypothetical protein